MRRPPTPAAMRLGLFLALVTTSAAAQPFVREATPFPVRDAAGVAVTFPFVGGFFEPRPNFADLDGDGDADLVLSVGGAGLQYFEKTPAGYVWRTDRLGDLEPGNWAAFGDLDRDGDLDLVTRGDPGRTRYYRNTGTSRTPVFTLVSNLLIDTSGEPVTIEDSSIPDLADADGDGDLDLLAGKADLGTVSFYRNDGLDAAGAPRYTFVTGTFEDIQVYENNPQCGNRPGAGAPRMDPGGPAAPALSETLRKHGANALRLVDLTADGRPELVWGDFFAPSLYFFSNAGTPQDPAFTLLSDRYPVGQPLTSGGYNASDFGDADGDGDLDLVVGVQRGLCFDPRSALDNLILYDNAGTPAAPDFRRVTDRLLVALDVGARATVAAFDVDGDGDTDLIVGAETSTDASGRARLTLIRNVGTPTAPSLVVEDADWLGLAYDYGGYGPFAGDIDGDGDPDLIVGGFNGRFALVRNTGTATAPVYTLDPATAGLTGPGWGGVDAGQYGRGTLGDLDGDGDLDLITGASNGRIGLYRNVGTPQAVSFLTKPNGIPQAADSAYALGIGIPGDTGEDSAPTLADLDGDGDLDLVIGTSTGALLFYRNTGTRTAPTFVAEAPVTAGRRRTAPALADLDGDGDLDLLAGTDAGGLLFWRRAGGTATESGSTSPAGGLRLDVRPNPSSGASHFVASAAVTGEATVFDVRGREVRRVRFTGTDAEWDGRDAQGRAVPPGVYLVRLRAGRREATARFTRVG